MLQEDKNLLGFTTPNEEEAYNLADIVGQPRLPQSSIVEPTTSSSAPN